MLYYITTRNVTPALGTAYGGIVLQRFEFVKRFALAVETHKTISRRNRVRSACEAGKQQRIQHGNRVSRFYSQNIRIIDFSSKAVAFPYKPLYKFKPL